MPALQELAALTTFHREALRRITAGQRIRGEAMPDEKAADNLAAHKGRFFIDGDDPLAEPWGSSPWVVVCNDAVPIERRGKSVYRRKGKAGADLPEPYFYWRMRKQQRAFETEIAKLNRPFKLRVSKQKAAADQAARIRELAKTVKGHKRIALKAGVSLSTVKRALQGKKGHIEKG